MVTAILGVLKAGGAYLPLDPALPRARLEYYIRDSGCRLVVTQERFLESIPVSPDGAICLDRERSAIVPWLVPVALLIAWEAAVDAGLLSTRILPAPSTVLVAGYHLSLTGELFTHIGVSFKRSAISSRVSNPFSRSRS